MLRLKHLIGLAPATFGSPLAHKGPSWLGALFQEDQLVGYQGFGSDKQTASLALARDAKRDANLDISPFLDDTA